MAIALVATVGGTPDPILKAIEETCAENGEVTVFLVYGRAFDGQAPCPFDSAKNAKDRAESLGAAPIRLVEVPDPEDLDNCLKTIRSVFEEVSSFKQVVVNFTGGTKVMSAAAVHAALTSPIVGELIFDYTGGPIREKDTGRVLREAMRVKRSERTWTDEQIRLVLEALRTCNYPRANALSTGLPDQGKAAFIREATMALYQWDAFLYEEAVNSLGPQHSAAQVMRDDPEAKSLAECALRLHEAGTLLKTVVRELRKAEHGGCPKLEQGAQLLLVADALENSARKVQSEEATDAVLRAYRAVEVAVQLRLIRSGINPWKADWNSLDADTRGRIRSRLERELPEQLALSSGLDVLKECGLYVDKGFDRDIQELQRMRNRSFLEHGYQRITVDDANRLHHVAANLCSQLTETDLTEFRQRVRHLSSRDHQSG